MTFSDLAKIFNDTKHLRQLSWSTSDFVTGWRTLNKKLTNRWDRWTLPPEPCHHCKTLPTLYSTDPQCSLNSSANRDFFGASWLLRHYYVTFALWHQPSICRPSVVFLPPVCRLSLWRCALQRRDKHFGNIFCTSNS